MRVTVKVRGQETPLRDGAARSTTRMMEGWGNFDGGLVNSQHVGQNQAESAADYQVLLI